MTFRFEPIGDDIKFDLKGVTKSLRDALETEGKEHRKLLRKTTEKWSGTKPQFRTKTVVGPTQLTVESAPWGQGEGAKKWWWLELGTKTRWALMSSDWRSKTQHRKLSSGSGAGQVIIAGRKAMQQRGIAARPGIKARDWRWEIHVQRSRKFKGLLQREFDIIARNIMSGTRGKALRGY